MDEVRAAIVGRFQMGKSSLINCLLSRQGAAPVGNGWRSKTAECDEYHLTDDIVLVDTPGFDDNVERDQITEKAIRRAHCVLLVADNRRDLDEVYVNWAWKLKELRKPGVLICNCWEDVSDEDWSPEDIGETFIGRNGFDVFMPINGRTVLTVNAKWDRQDNIDVLREFICNVRLELLAHFLAHKARIVNELTDRFCEEFSKRLAKKEGA